MSDEEQAAPSNAGEGTAAERLGREAGRIVRAGWPGVRRLAKDLQPRAEATGREAARFAKAHDAEIKTAGMRLLRGRFVGPLGLVIDALETELRRGPTGEPSSAAAEGACPSCGSANPSRAKFCNECGAKLTG